MCNMMVSFISDVVSERCNEMYGVSGEEPECGRLAVQPLRSVRFVCGEGDRLSLLPRSHKPTLQHCSTIVAVHMSRTLYQIVINSAAILIPGHVFPTHSRVHMCVCVGSFQGLQIA